MKTPKLILLVLLVAATAAACSPVSDPIFQATSTSAVELAPNESTVPPSTTTPREATTVTPTNSLTPDLRGLPQVAQAKADLAERLNVTSGDIEVVSVEAVVWPDGSFGCPKPGMEYAQVLQEGLLIVLRFGGREYAYHSGGTQAPFLCENAVGTVKTTPIVVGGAATEDPDY